MKELADAGIQVGIGIAPDDSRIVDGHSRAVGTRERMRSDEGVHQHAASCPAASRLTLNNACARNCRPKLIAC